MLSASWKYLLGYIFIPNKTGDDDYNQMLADKIET